MPFDPTTRTTTVGNAKVPQASLEHERTTTSAEEEFIQRGPVHLLEAVYCDPCKAKVMDLCQTNIHAWSPGSLQFPDKKISGDNGSNL